MGEMPNECNTLVGKRGRDNHLEGLGINGRIILQPLLKKDDVRK
jgi:hypothetical protein